MSALIPFHFHEHDIRVVDQGGEPWFVAKDVAEVLGYAKPENAVARHCKAQSTTPKQGGGSLTLIPERDVYRLIMRSKLPAAEQFEDWVVGEVLPTIRKTGGYAQQAPAELSRLEILQMAMQSEEERVKLAAQNTALIGAMQEAKPKVEFHDQVVKSEDAISVAQAAKILGTGQKRLMAFMRRKHMISIRNEPYQKMITSGYLDIKLSSWEHPDFGLKQSVITLVTGKGLAKLRQLMAEEKETPPEVH